MKLRENRGKGNIKLIAGIENRYTVEKIQHSHTFMNDCELNEWNCQVPWNT